LSKKTFPSIPLPGVTPHAQQETLLALKQAIETLGGLKGDGAASAVTFDDLVALGLVTREQAKKVYGAK